MQVSFIFNFFLKHLKVSLLAHLDPSICDHLKIVGDKNTTINGSMVHDTRLSCFPIVITVKMFLSFSFLVSLLIVSFQTLYVKKLKGFSLMKFV